MSNSSIWTIDRTLSVTSRVELEAIAMKKYSRAGASTSDCLMSYPGHSMGMNLTSVGVFYSPIRLGWNMKQFPNPLIDLPYIFIVREFDRYDMCLFPGAWNVPKKIADRAFLFAQLRSEDLLPGYITRCLKCSQSGAVFGYYFPGTFVHIKPTLCHIPVPSDKLIHDLLYWFLCLY